MAVLKELLFFDSTLRDGSHAVKQNLTLEGIEKYCEGIDSAGMHTVIVGHGNGLGASSIQMGLCGMDEFEMLRVARIGSIFNSWFWNGEWSYCASAGARC